MECESFLHFKQYNSVKSVLNPINIWGGEIITVYLTIIWLEMVYEIKTPIVLVSD